MKLNITVIIIITLLSTALHSQWSRLNTTGNVPHLKNHSAIYVPAGNYMLVYGGRTSTGLSGELWKLDLATYQWTQLTPVGTSPAPRYTQNAYYDSAAHRMIIWSGQGTELYNDVWAYNISSNSWQLLWQNGNVSGAPLKRYGTASVFEPALRRFTTFAGFTTSGRFEDTWTFNVDNMTWAERTNNPHPPKRCLHSSVYAGETGRFIIYGGQDTGPLDDIWQCDLSNFTWSNITPAVKPPARFWNSIVYSGSGSIIIFGGLGSNPLGDMWKFTLGSNTWEQVSQGAVFPAARWGHTAVYVPQQDRMIIFGGEGDSLYTDTWQYTSLSVIGIEPVSQVIPNTYSLHQNYPNPFNPATKIQFQVPTPGFAKLTVINTLGEVVHTLVNGHIQSGTYEVDFDGSSLSSGVYFYRLTAGGFTQTRKMVIVK